jgi:hypothetical protein
MSEVQDSSSFDSLGTLSSGIQNFYELKFKSALILSESKSELSSLYSTLYLLFFKYKMLFSKNLYSE